MIPYKLDKIIVRMPNWIGDLIMATPVLSDIRRFFPKAHITAMVINPTGDLLKGDHDIDELFCFNKIRSLGRRDERRDIVENLRRGNYDLGIILPLSFSSAWYFWLGHVRRRVGYPGRGRRFFLTEPVSFPNHLHQQHLVTTYKMVLDPLGIPISDTRPRIFLSDEEIVEARRLLKRFGVSFGHTVVGINPGAAYGSAKCWLPDRFQAVTKKFTQHPKIRVVYFGDSSSSGLVKEICRGFPTSVINLAGLTALRELAALIKCCDVVLTNDSGPMHIAAALGVPLVALFASTSEVVTGPYKTGTVIHKHVPCSPCFRRKCPIDFRCMKQIEVKEVYEAVTSLLKVKNDIKKNLEKNTT